MHHHPVISEPIGAAADGHGGEASLAPLIQRLGEALSLLGFGGALLVAISALPEILAVPMASTIGGAPLLSVPLYALGALWAYRGVRAPVAAGQRDGYLAYAALLGTAVSASAIGVLHPGLCFFTTIGALFTVSSAPRETHNAPLDASSRHRLVGGSTLIGVALLVTLLG
jgi:hypothetical protein